MKRLPAILLVLLLPSVLGATTAPKPALPAIQFLNTIGVGTKIIQGDNEMANANAVGYLGARWIRDDATHDTNLIASLCALHASTGAMVDELPVVDWSGQNATDTQIEWEQLAACGAMGYAEGPNEPNNFGFTADDGTRCDGSTYVGCVSTMEALYNLVHTDTKFPKGLTLWGMTDVGYEPEDDGLQFLTVPAGEGTLNDGATFADVATAHNYFQTNTILCNPLDNQIRDAETIAPNPSGSLLMGEYWGSTWGRGFAGASTGQNDRPKVTTETGWNAFKCNPATDRSLQGKMTVSVYLDAYQMGWSRTAVYETFERGDCDSGYGFFLSSLQNTYVNCGPTFDAAITASYDPSLMSQYAMPAGAYLHNLTTILSDGTAHFTPTPVSFVISGLPATGYRQLFQKSPTAPVNPNKHELVIWGEAWQSGTSTPISVSLGSVYASVNVYDVTLGATPTQTLTNASSVALTLSDHPLIVEF